MAGAASAQITISVLPSSAPNAAGSPSFAGYQSNAIAGISAGLPNYGDPTLPTFYQTTEYIPSTHLIVTGFPSWQGLTNPGATFGPAFANEYGNRLHFGLHILGNGTQFSASQLSFSATGTGVGAGLDFGFASGYTYGASLIGINYVDGIKGNGNDIVVNGGSATTLVDEIIARGSGNGFAVYAEPGISNQQGILNALEYITDFQYTGTYTLNLGNNTTVSGSRTVQVVAVPEPGAWALLAGATLGGGLLLRRRRIFGRRG
jgi:hypothetical protein